MREGAGEDIVEEQAAGLAGPSMLRKLEDDFECVICRDLLVGAHTLVPCGHVFCGQCLHDWLQKKANCPNCRTKVTAAPVPALLINNTAEGLEGGLSPEDAAERDRRKKQWKEVAATAMAGWQAMFAAGGRGRAPKPRIQHIRGTGVYHGSHVQSGLDDGGLQAQLRAAAEARVDLPRMPRFYPRRSPRTPEGRSAEREIVSAEAHMAEQRQRVQQLMADMARRATEFPEGPRYYGYIGRRPPTPPARHGEVPGMPGQAVQQDSECSVGYHAGSRATCMGCPRPIAPPEVRMQRRSRIPPGGVMIQQYWHPQCFPGWATLPHPLPGVEQLRPHDQGAVQARMILH